MLDDIDVGDRRGQQHLLFLRLDAGPFGLDVVDRDLVARLPAAAVVERLVDTEARVRRIGPVLDLGRDVAKFVVSVGSAGVEQGRDHRAPGTVRLGYPFVDDPQVGTLGLQFRIGLVGHDQRLFEGLGAHRGSMCEHGEPDEDTDKDAEPVSGRACDIHLSVPRLESGTEGPNYGQFMIVA